MATLKELENKLWKYFSFEINHNKILLSKNDQALYLRFNTTESVKKEIITKIKTKILDNTTELYTHNDTIMLGDVSTPEANFLFQEAKVGIEMEALLELQKKVLDRKTSLIDSLKSLVDANKELPEDSEYFNKYDKDRVKDIAEVI